MKHYSEEDLILHFYGERGRWTTRAGHRRRRREIEQHVDTCQDCSALYQSLAATLHLLDGLQQTYTPAGGAMGEAFHSYLGSMSSQRWERLADLRAGRIVEAEVFD